MKFEQNRQIEEGHSNAFLKDHSENSISNANWNIDNLENRFNNNFDDNKRKLEEKSNQNATKEVWKDLKEKISNKDDDN